MDIKHDKLGDKHDNIEYRDTFVIRLHYWEPFKVIGISANRE